MSVYKVTVEVDGRSVESILKAGVPATMEVGTHKDQVTSPEHRISMMVTESDDQPAAWVQVAKIQAETVEVLAEGWLGNDSNLKALNTFGAVPTGTITVASEKEASARLSPEHAAFGCCTAYGNGCYVRCCNGCCSDPGRCPGASCCG
ncbi:hypothetical protein KRZ98_17600 [Sphingobium sp. AS12]|uniref:hypothetical protein n=1 Tax=Sphingobium sp. AS12 TaxID=2849495 RepID=UPI001C31830C|nr:hypothetical protein [Sphingobium sp. AS12]MBV2150061.1 hypothetical protein [Sphingobium sp. AS12]